MALISNSWAFFLTISQALSTIWELTEKSLFTFSSLPSKSFTTNIVLIFSLSLGKVEGCNNRLYSF